MTARLPVGSLARVGGLLRAQHEDITDEPEEWSVQFHEEATSVQPSRKRWTVKLRFDTPLLIIERGPGWRRLLVDGRMGWLQTFNLEDYK